MLAGNLIRLICSGLISASLATAMAAELTSTEAAPSTDIPVVNSLPKGRKIFQQYCSVCHGTKGEGGMGPALKGVFVQKGKDAVVAQITKPQGSMPLMYPNPIDEKALADLLVFLENLK
jgi:mono/diheme cytochrome c family protein